MHASRRCLLPALAAFVLIFVAADSVDTPKVDLRVAKYDEMGDLIKSLKGKIVVVDFWADT